MDQALTARHGGRSARIIKPTARLTLAAALCVLAMPANGGWVQHAHLFADDAAANDYFGKAVAVDGDTLVVGADFEDTAVGGNEGSAYVFVRSGRTWSQQAHLFADDAAANDHFGNSVAISGDTIVVGASWDETAEGNKAGSAYVFTRTGGTWSQQDHLFADDAEPGDEFGFSVAIDGDTIVVGADSDDLTVGANQGSAYVFTRSGGIWSQQDHLIADDAAPGDIFGYSVAISGDTIVGGAVWDENSVGSAYVFIRSGVTWSQQAHLFANASAAGDHFGSSVAIDGDTIVVGADNDNTDAGVNAGSAFVFTRSGITWSQQDQLLADDAVAGDWLGGAVALDGDTIVVGAVRDESGAGSAYVFTRSAGVWSQLDHLFAEAPMAGDNFGHSVAISGDTIAVGAVYDDTAAGIDAGSAYVFGPSLEFFIAEPELLSGH